MTYSPVQVGSIHRVNNIIKRTKDPRKSMSLPNKNRRTAGQDQTNGGAPDTKINKCQTKRSGGARRAAPNSAGCGANRRKKSFFSRYACANFRRRFFFYFRFLFIFYFVILLPPSFIILAPRSRRWSGDVNPNNEYIFFNNKI